MKRPTEEARARKNLTKAARKRLSCDNWHEDKIFKHSHCKIIRYTQLSKLQQGVPAFTSCPEECVHFKKLKKGEIDKYI